eukprot:10381873-Karenia_brevis.AAC.1
MRKTGDDNKGQVVQWLQRKHVTYVWEEAHRAYASRHCESPWPLSTFRDRLSRQMTVKNKQLKEVNEEPMD